MRKTRAATGAIDIKNMKEPEGLNFGKKVESRKINTEKKKIEKQPSNLQKEEEEFEEEIPKSSNQKKQKDENHNAIDMRKEDAELEKIL